MTKVGKNFMQSVSVNSPNFGSSRQKIFRNLIDGAKKFTNLKSEAKEDLFRFESAGENGQFEKAFLNPEVINKYLEKLTYQEDIASIVSPKNNFHIYQDSNGLTLKNYHNANAKKIIKKVEKGVLPEVKGTCGDLTKYLGKVLSDKYPDIDVLFCNGKEMRYFNSDTSNHCYLELKHPDAKNMVRLDPSFKLIDPKFYFKEASDSIGNIPLKEDALYNDSFIPKDKVGIFPLGFLDEMSSTRESKFFAQRFENMRRPLLQFGIGKSEEVEGDAFTLTIKEEYTEKNKIFKDWKGWLGRLERDNPLREFVAKITSHPGIGEY